MTHLHFFSFTWEGPCLEVAGNSAVLLPAMFLKYLWPRSAMQCFGSQRLLRCN